MHYHFSSLVDHLLSALPSVYMRNYVHAASNIYAGSYEYNYFGAKTAMHIRDAPV